MFYYHVFFKVIIFVFCSSHWSQFDSFQEGVWGRRRSLELTRWCGCGCYHYESISFLHLLHSYGVSSYCHQRCPLSLWAMRISSAWLAVESTSDKLFGYCRPYFRFHGRVMLLKVESQTNVDPTLGPVMYVVTFEFSYGGRVNGRGKNYKLECDVLFKCTCECYKHHTNSANISKRSVLSTFPRSSKIFKLWLFSFAISIRWWIIFFSNTRTMK